jgi:disulfide bond formation protein DsbB
MQLAQVIQSRKARPWVVLIALAILVILIVAVFFQSRRSPKPFEMDDLYGLLD